MFHFLGQKGTENEITDLATPNRLGGKIHFLYQRHLFV